MLLGRIEKSLIKIQENLNKDNFIFDFLEAYEQPKASIKRLKDGDYNLSKKINEVIWKKKLHFYSVNTDEDIHEVIDTISKNEFIEKNKIRFIIVTDFKEFLSIDKKDNSTLDISFFELSKNAHFFLPLSGLEKAKNILETEADIKAAEKMGKFYDLLISTNLEYRKQEKENILNIFFTRILFCLYAEDTDIFQKNIFSKSIYSYTNEDGTDVDIFLINLFVSLNNSNKNDLPNYLKEFPYVNGELFSAKLKIPKFNKETRKLLISLGDLDWEKINPDIFGSMMQAIVHHGFRKDFGMHYTSISNILKLIKPLFLDNLIKRLNAANNDEKKLKKILQELYNFRFIDPACGCGNFLLVSYKEICKIEIEIYKKLKNLDNNSWLILKSNVQLNQFYGLEIDDYACQSAKLSLWIAQHQMNVFFKSVFGDTKPTLPLTPSGNIFCENAARIDWIKFFEKKITNNPNVKFFVFGNPPYGGHENRTVQQKEDFQYNLELSPKLDYISIWFLKAVRFIKNKNASIAFVTTRSICTGEQVEKLWPKLFESQIKINFAFKPFWWKNNAKYNATVMCTIIGIENSNSQLVKLFDQNTIIESKLLSPYLVPNVSTIVEKVSKNPISVHFPKITFGNMPRDNGYLILTDEEKNNLLSNSPNLQRIIRKLIGAKEFLKGEKRWCFWIKDADLMEAEKNNFVNQRLKLVQKFREKSNNLTTKKFAEFPHRFVEIRHQEKQCLIIPITTSSVRKYIPMAFSNSNDIITNTMNMIYDAPMYLFSLLQSKMHMLWVFTISGYMGPSIRYSAELSYNTFPCPNLSENDKHVLEKLALEILDDREKFSQMALDELYQPNKIPDILFKKHSEVDDFVDKIFQIKPFKDDYERLELLFRMYNELKNKRTLL